MSRVQLALDGDDSDAAVGFSTVLDHVETPGGRLRTIDPAAGDTCVATPVGEAVDAGSSRCC
ncbi:hypothetical protein BH20ACT2_BH20ACT2_19770 [soil metagenome]